MGLRLIRSSRKTAPFVLACLLAPLSLTAQDGGTGLAPAPAAGAAPASTGKAAKASELVPVFPDEAAGLFFVEGEDAVSTNMAAEATLNYGVSGNRALQLSRTGRLPGDKPYYAEYLFYVEKDGSYELWYGGTPPGPRDEFSVSLSSPFGYSLDDAPLKAVHREDVNVVEQYAPAFYWVRIGPLELKAGSHRVRMEISEKRRIDDSYFFYLDALFLVDSADLASFGASGQARKPKLFPKDLSYRGIDKPFRSIEDYQAYIQSNPNAVAAYVELSSVYSFQGDYLGALKTLSRAAILEPRNPDVRLLIAKNRIWRGDLKEGIEAFRAYLRLRRDDRMGYEEAGKVAAWTGRYADSISFYKEGLAAFPGDLSLGVNLGLTQLWSSAVGEAETSFALAEKAALSNPEDSLSLGSIYRSNGYPDRALSFYDRAIAVFPQYLALYFGVEDTLASLGRSAEADAVQKRVATLFEPSPRLSAVLDSYLARRDLKADRIRALEAKVVEKPDDLTLREELTRVYFWNGLKEKAVRQLESTLATLFVRSLDESDLLSADLGAGGVAASALRAEAEARLLSLSRLATEAQEREKALAAAWAVHAAWDKKRATAEAAGKQLPPAEGPFYGQGLLDKVAAADENLLSALTALRQELSRIALLVERSEQLRAGFDTAAEKERQAEENFRKLVVASGWDWDPKYAGSELGIPASRGEEIAAYGQARVLAQAGDAKGALAVLASLSSPALAERRAAAELLVRVRVDYKEARNTATRAKADGSQTPLPLLATAIQELAAITAAEAPSLPPPPRSTPSSEAPATGTDASSPIPPPAAAAATEGKLPFSADYETYLKGALKEALDTVPTLRRAAADAQAFLAFAALASTTLADKRLVRTWYSFEEQSLFRRAELGAYYDGLGFATKAAAQYRRVLAVDPSNLPAMYNLSLAEDRAGNWAKASRLLRAVNAADPEYGNAAAVQNRIARLHAPGIEAETSLSSDANRLAYKGKAAADFPLGSALSFRSVLGLDSIRERSLGLPAYLLGSWRVEAPLVLDSWANDGKGAIIKPDAVFLGSSADFSRQGASSLSPSAFIESLNLVTAGGAGLDWRSEPAYGNFSYQWEPLIDSLNPVRTPLFAHKAEFSAASYYPIRAPFRFFAPRVYASANYVPVEDNVFGTALVELMPAFRLSDSPWSNLAIPLDILFEHSKTPRSTPYYAADSALTAKGGLLWSSSWALGESSLSVSLQALGGIYQARTLSLPFEPSPYAQVYGRVDWLRGDASYWLAFEVTATDPLKEVPAYWSISILGGISAKQPRLIAP